jgi:hypothetical protein
MRGRRFLFTVSVTLLALDQAESYWFFAPRGAGLGMPKGVGMIYRSISPLGITR